MISLVNLDRALEIAALAIADDPANEFALAAFERIEREIERRESDRSAVERARRVVGKGRRRAA